jgi:predicted nucleic-acid-binding Zn-ribbon protein
LTDFSFVIDISYSRCSACADENDGLVESESSVNTHSNEAPLNIQLDEFYNYTCKMCEPETATFSSFFLLTKHYRCVKVQSDISHSPF